MKHSKVQTPAKRKNPNVRFGWLIGLFAMIVGSLSPIALPSAAYANTVTNPSPGTQYQCGSGQNAVKTSINIGCRGASCQTTNIDGCSALLDATFAIIRFLSTGVGIVVIGSVIWAGIQYTTARDDPSAVGKAKTRIMHSLGALLLFIFGYAILNFVIPAGFFK